MVPYAASNEAFFAALSDLVLDIHELFENGSQLGCRFTLHGTPTGDLAGIAPTARRIQQPGVTVVRFGADRVVERYSVAEMATSSPSSPRADGEILTGPAQSRKRSEVLSREQDRRS